MCEFERKRVFYFYLYSSPKSQFRKKLIVQSAIYNMRMCSPRTICKQVTCCICPISDTDTANKSVNRGFRNVKCETSVYGYPGLIVNPG